MKDRCDKERCRLRVVMRCDENVVNVIHHYTNTTAHSFLEILHLMVISLDVFSPFCVVPHHWPPNPNLYMIIEPELLCQISLGYIVVVNF